MAVRRRIDAVIGRLPEDLHPEVAQEALDAARSIEDVMYRAMAIMNVTGLLPEDLRPEMVQQALDAARSIEDIDYRAQALADLLGRLIAHLPEDVPAEVTREILDSATSGWWWSIEDADTMRSFMEALNSLSHRDRTRSLLKLCAHSWPAAEAACL